MVGKTGFTHFDQSGNAVMVDVSDKEESCRNAVAQGRIKVNDKVFAAVAEGKIEKGDVLGVARIAGIMGAKKTAEMIPMCHPLLLTKVGIDFHLYRKTREIEAVCTVKVKGNTGVEMEALTGVNIALLTIYDMCKALDKRMVMDGLCLQKKSGGKSGDFKIME